MLSAVVYADTERNLASQINRNNPFISMDYQEFLAKTVYRIAKDKGINPKLLSAVLMQESSYRPIVRETSTDIGIGQINARTADHYGFDKNRLKFDLEYSITSAATILADLKTKYASKEPQTWFTRYHSYTPHHRMKYLIALQRWF